MDPQEENLIGFYRRMLDAMPGLVFVKDTEGRFTECNSAYVEYMGATSAADIIGKTDFDFYPENLARRFAEDDRRVMASESGESLEYVQSEPGPDGRLHHLRMRKQRSADALGRPCLLGTAVDQTGIQEALDRAVQAEKAKSYFFSTVSHDIRTPLNAIVGFSQLLKIGIRNPDDREKALTALVSSSNTLLKLIGDVLDLSKLEAGTMKLVTETTDVKKLIGEVTAPFEPVLKAKNLEFMQHIVEMPLLELDAQRVRQILLNLFGNAVKFTESGKVGVSAEYADGTLVLSVQDTGCGIAPEDQLRIADPYVQAGNGRHGGTGLGLAIVKHLVFRMGGEMSLKSGVGVGTVFTVTLPNIRPASASRSKAYSVTQRIKIAITSRAERKTKNVLLVDDSKLNLIVLKSLLVKLGYVKLTLAENGREAWDLLLANPAYDIVLTDVWMPEMDGRELAAAIAGDARLKHIKVYAVTADPEIRTDNSAGGFLDVFMKPLTLEALGKVL